MDYFYHYTTTKNAEKILCEGLKPGIPVRKPDPRHPFGSHKPAFFGLHEAVPQSWAVEKYDHTDSASRSVLAQLLLYIANLKDGLVLLKVRLSPEDDIYVRDYDVVRKKHEGGGPEAIDCSSYISKFQGDFDIASKKLPEILCFNSIPPERIELVEKIPVHTPDGIKTYMSRKFCEQLAEEEKKTGNIFLGREPRAYVDAKKNKTANTLPATNSPPRKPGYVGFD